MTEYEKCKQKVAARLAEDAPPLSASERAKEMEALRALYGKPRRQVEMPMSWLAPVNGDDGGPEE